MHTGNTSVPHLWSGYYPVHPRAYGEHDRGEVIAYVEPGSSPCIRGTRGGGRYAGPLGSVHPRAYGEHSVRTVPQLLIHGSSPCIRGTPLDYSFDIIPLRFIPVHTGNTKSAARSPRIAPVHPRAYGEHRRCPRVRPPLFRFIPVHTGNTASNRPRRRLPTVHPRAYGEHRLKQAEEAIAYGSSPCIRGTRSQPSLGLRLRRFIPVHTGNTL